MSGTQDVEGVRREFGVWIAAYLASPRHPIVDSRLCRSDGIGGEDCYQEGGDDFVPFQNTNSFAGVCAPAVWLNLQGRNSPVDTRLCTYGLAAKADDLLQLVLPIPSVSPLSRGLASSSPGPSSTLHFLFPPKVPRSPVSSRLLLFESFPPALIPFAILTTSPVPPDNNINPPHHVLPSLVRSAQRSGVPCQYH